MLVSYTSDSGEVTVAVFHKTKVDCTLLLVVDDRHLSELCTSYPTWVYFNEEIQEMPVVLLYDESVSENDERIEWLMSLGSRSWKFIKWPDRDLKFNSHREKMLRAYIDGPTYVDTEWFLKIDTDAICTSDKFSLYEEEWFKENSFVSPTIELSNAVIETMDEWSKSIGLNKYEHKDSPRMISWLMFGKTEDCVEMSKFLTDVMPVCSQDIYHSYFARRLGVNIKGINFENRGWMHKSLKEKSIKYDFEHDPIFSIAMKCVSDVFDFSPVYEKIKFLLEENMRIFTYALQSSGASLFCYWLSQLEGCLGIIDLYARGGYLKAEEFPRDRTVFLKATLNKGSSLGGHLSQFKPHKSILFLRDPVQNYASLKGKRYEGDIDSKFEMMNRIFLHMKDEFDIIITYEDFMNNREAIVKQLLDAGIPASTENYSFHRSYNEIVKHNQINNDTLKKTYGTRWGSGNVHFHELENLTEIKREITKEVEERVRTLCPDLMRFYDKRQSNSDDALVEKNEEHPENN
jgi:hypothetical protein